MLRTAKLTDLEVIALRARKANGEHIDVKLEADRFNCGVETIRKALRGDTFRHLLRETAAVESAKEVSEEDAKASLERFMAELAANAPLENPDDDIQSLLGNLGGNT